MSELEQAFNFKELGEEGLDFDAIFGGGNIPAPPPPVPETVQEPEYAPENGATAEQPSVQDTTNTDAGTVPDMVRADTGNEPDLFAALAGNSGTNVPAAKPKEDKPKQVSLFDKPPIFSYGGAKESIKDTSMTFEELRIAKSDDFPELAEGKKVSWLVEYGKTTKYISDPKETTIASVKEEIEKWDGAEDSDIEAVKGGLSDSMKRAAVQWGVGRVLYSMDTVWVGIEARGDSFVIKDTERKKLDDAYLGKPLSCRPASTCWYPSGTPWKQNALRIWTFRICGKSWSNSAPAMMRWPKTAPTPLTRLSLTNG